MKLVVDANTLISAFMKQSKTAELLVHPSLQLYAPQFIGDEILKYKEEITIRTKRSIESFNMIISEIFSLIIFVPPEEVKTQLQQAAEISPDPKDVPYLALALFLQCPLWSNDRELREKQKEVKVYTTQKLQEELQYLNRT